MSNIIEIKKSIIIKYEERETKLSKDIKEKIEISQSKRVTYDLSSYSWHHIAQQTKEIYDSLIV